MLSPYPQLLLIYSQTIFSHRKVDKESIISQIFCNTYEMQMQFVHIQIKVCLGHDLSCGFNYIDADLLPLLLTLTILQKLLQVFMLCTPFVCNNSRCDTLVPCYCTNKTNLVVWFHGWALTLRNYSLV